MSDVPGFDYAPGYTGFQFVFVLLQSAAFGGVFTGFGIARDFESGFARRLLLASPRRSGIVLGYSFAALVRWVTTASVLTVVAIVAGMNVGGGPVDIFGLYGLALIVNVTATLWAAGVAMRLRTMQAGPVMQMPVFLILFFAPVYVPIDLLQGWIETVASVNPVTALLEAGARSSRASQKCRACVRRGVGPRRGVRGLGGARAAARGARRLRAPLEVERVAVFG